MTDTPSPGSALAFFAGCKCPRADNAHGKGYMGGAKDRDGNVMFVMVCTCPIHGMDAQPEKWENL